MKFEQKLRISMAIKCIGERNRNTRRSPIFPKLLTNFLFIMYQLYNQRS